MQVPAFLAVLVLSFYPCVLRAQPTNASLTGRVTDPSKAAIAEARIYRHQYRHKLSVRHREQSLGPMVLNALAGVVGILLLVGSPSLAPFWRS